MISKVCYLNDEQKDIVVRVLDTRYDVVTSTGDIYVTLKACESGVFEVHMPPHHILWVKKWPQMVLISHADPAGLARPQGLLSAEDVT